MRLRQRNPRLSPIKPGGRAKRESRRQPTDQRKGPIPPNSGDTSRTRTAMAFHVLNLRCFVLLVLSIDAIFCTLIIERGIRGLPGLAGPMGPQGWIGPTGLPGPRGEQGDDGPIGTQGIMGRLGAKGLPGPVGHDGNSGPPGATGFCPARMQRPENVDCKYGSTGSDGARGEPGNIGYQGRAGFAGSAGKKGPKGARGERGAPGSRGSPGMLTMIECREATSRYTKPNKFKRGKHAVKCSFNNQEFLQGFSIESRGVKIRYRYRCCHFTRVF